MNYVVIQDIWGTVGEIVKTFKDKRKANEYVVFSYNDYYIINMTDEELNKARENKGYIEF